MLEVDLNSCRDFIISQVGFIAITYEDSDEAKSCLSCDEGEFRDFPRFDDFLSERDWYEL